MAAAPAATLRVMQTDVPTMNPSLLPDALLVQRLQAELSGLRRDLAACRQREALALRAAQLDPLTGLANRRLLDHQLDVHLGRPESGTASLALLFIDLDGFKAVNDRHGHAVGDAVLKLVARRLRHALRQDDLACRIGGDEFVCVLFGALAADEAQAVARKLRAAVGQPCRLGPLTVQVWPSVGVALCPQHGRSSVQLLAHADGEMYRCKAGARRSGSAGLGRAGGAEHAVPQVGGHAEVGRLGVA